MTRCLSMTEEVDIPESHEGLPVTAVADLAFEGRQYLRRVSIPSSVRSIGAQSFLGCHNLEQVTFSEGLESIGYAAFASCRKLKEINLPESLEELGHNAFAGTAVASIKIPSKITVIPKQCFYKCCNLKEILLPEGVTDLEDECFGDVPLEEIVLPSSIRFIDPCAFRNDDYYVSGTTFDIVFKGTIEQWPGNLKEMRNYFSEVGVVHCLDGDFK